MPHTGLSVLPFLFATILVYLFGGPIADRISNSVTRMNGGAREPEHHLLNLIIPLVSGLMGTFIFGWAGQSNKPWAVTLVGSFLKHLYLTRHHVGYECVYGIELLDVGGPRIW